MEQLPRQARRKAEAMGDMFDHHEELWDAVDDVHTPLDDEDTRAMFLGEERAGCPGWSKSAARVAGALAALLASVDPPRRARLAALEQQAFDTAKARKRHSAEMWKRFEAMA